MTCLGHYHCFRSRGNITVVPWMYSSGHVRLRTAIRIMRRRTNNRVPILSRSYTGTRYDTRRTLTGTKFIVQPRTPEPTYRHLVRTHIPALLNERLRRETIRLPSYVYESVFRPQPLHTQTGGQTTFHPRLPQQKLTKRLMQTGIWNTNASNMTN